MTYDEFKYDISELRKICRNSGIELDVKMNGVSNNLNVKKIVIELSSKEN